jgi:Acetyltransferase (GNAT) domain
MTILGYKEGDEIAIQSLFKSAFNRDMSIEYWDWRFKRNPAGKTMIKLMWDADFLVGHYAVCPVYVNVCGVRTLAALSMTTMTHPLYTGRGIFSELADQLYQSLSQEFAIEFVWGFPNVNSHYGFIKNLGWKDLAVVPTLSLSTSQVKPVQDDAVYRHDQIDHSFLPSVSAVTSKYEVGVLRDIEYLKWRYLECPTIKYDIFSVRSDKNLYFLVLKIFKSFDYPTKYEIDLVEFFMPVDAGLVLRALQAILAHYRAYDVVKINAWIPLGDDRHGVLEKIGFSYDKPLTYMGIKSLGNPDLGTYIDFRNWYFSMGDSDVF